MGRQLTEMDRAAWDVFVHGAKPPSAGTAEGAAADTPAAGAAGVPRPKRIVPLVPNRAPPGLDKASWQRFRSGRLATERTLDLHGRTAAAAHAALVVFLQAASADDIRCVEVITGKGSGEAGGVLRRELPHWMEQPAVRSLILAAAHPHPANQGAVRLLLRRRR